MTKIYYIMGKSAVGKDTIYKRIREKIDIKNYTLYTTRPIRVGEKEGVDYFFVTDKEIEKFEKEGMIIESRTYNTVQGPWTYATILDEQLKKQGNILTIGTLESYAKIKKYFEKDKEIQVIPIYITVNNEELKRRAVTREKKQQKPNFEEVERRIKADNIDFSKEKLEQCGITKKETFENYDLETCVDEIIKYICK